MVFMFSFPKGGILVCLSYATFGITGTGTHLPFVYMQAYRYGVMFF